MAERAVHLPGADPWKLIDQVRKGLPYSVVASLRRTLGVSEEELARLASISPRTLARRRAMRRFNELESERLLRLARIADRCVDFFRRDTEAAQGWLRAPHAALRGQAPIEVARSEVGAREVENLLGRIAHGIPV